MNAQVKSPGAAETRRLAEAKLAEREVGLGTLAVDEARALHELKVHQIELEMQNEALQEARAQVEAELHRYADLYDFAPVGYLTFESDGTIRELNLAAAQLLAAERARLVGRRLGVFVAMASRPIFSRFLEVAFATKAKQTCEVELAREGHAPLTVKIVATPCSDGRGCRAVVIDLTERKRAEEALFEAETLQHAIFNSANFSSIATDAKGVIQIFNVGAERMLGYAASDVVNKITPADISDPREVIARAEALSVELGTPITPGFEALVFKASRGIEDIYELTYIRKDGTRFPATVSVTALRNAQDAIIGYLLIGTDNTARRQIEEERQRLDQRLRDQQFYTRSLIESGIDALMTTDPSGIITDVNKQTEVLTGCTRDELIGAPFKNHFTDPDQAEAGIKLVLSKKKVSNYELTVCARDGKRTVVSYNATTFYDRDRVLLGVFAAARDVTVQKQAEMDLQKAKAAAESANDTKSAFLSSMSHEIRTPMNVIMGIVELLAKTSLSPEQDKYVQVFRRAGDTLLNLINDILDLSKIEASQIELERTEFSLSELLERLTEMVEVKARQKELTLVCEIAPDTRTHLIGDPARLQQVLLNLLGNAVKFTKSGQVSLRVTAETGSAAPTALRFRVTDTGIGIADDKLDRVFEPFTQADSSTTRRFGGSGLGLTISRRLVELMGGRIWATSTVGEGSVFSFILPFERWAGSTRPPVVREDRTDHEAVLPALRILLADDSPDNCTITVAYLKDTPYQVDIAETGMAACEMFEAGAYDMVLMDRQMPVMDGLTATRKIRAWEEANGRPPTPIVALTASALKGDRETCLAAGCTAFLTKPIKRAVLLRAIREHSIVAPPPPGGVEHPEASPRLPSKGPSSMRGRAVVVEDSDDLRDLLTVMLESLGFVVEVAADGVAGSALILSSWPDVAFIDLGLPGLDGFQVAQSVRASPDSAKTRLVAVTGFGGAETQARALAAGFDSHLLKPVRAAHLAEVLAKHPLKGA